VACDPHRAGSRAQGSSAPVSGKLLTRISAPTRGARAEPAAIYRAGAMGDRGCEWRTPKGDAMITQTHREGTTTPPSSLFSRVIVGVDASPESRVAVRQAAALMDRGYLELLAAHEIVYPAAVSGLVVAGRGDDYARASKEAATEALEQARRVAPDGVVAKVVEGRPANALLEAAERERATVIAVGSHGHGRTVGILLGSTATEIVHRAPCSVLIARGEMRPRLRTIVVGIDGSSESAAAYAAASELADRLGAELWPVVGHGGGQVDHEAVAALAPRREELPDDPVKALVTASADADLLVVGSRGLHGLKALGSVSERVAHQAHCSTLVVRPSAR
jgi:nucleotide-binding universal stress UspA family protein